LWNQRSSVNADIMDIFELFSFFFFFFSAGE
jgi:hypothetical protein